MTTQRSNVQDWQTCLSEDVILAFQRGETTAAERHHIHGHVDACDHCRGLVLLAARLGQTADANAQSSNQRLVAFMDGGFRWNTFAQGKRLAQRFDILRFVQRGGMGEVYEAFDCVVGSRVALKTLLGTAADSAHALERQSQEVNLARRVAHPHVCRIYDLHEHREQGQPMRFLAMEFVDGETLKDRLHAAELTIAEACAVALQLLQGLGAIHAAGVLHLDFKSQNVMLRSGATPVQAVVMDFSLSRAFEKELRLRTSERQLAGSVGYMSPEQLECQPTLGPASDVYAFGVVFFEMLTRRMPFEGESLTSIMLKQLKSQPPAPSSLRPGIGPALDDFVLTCLSRQPRGRFQSVEAALLELERCMRLQGGHLPGKAARRRRKALAAALLAGVFASLAALGHSARQTTVQVRRTTAPLAVSEIRAALPAAAPASARPAEAGAPSSALPSPHPPAPPLLQRGETRRFTTPPAGAPAPARGSPRRPAEAVARQAALSPGDRKAAARDERSPEPPPDPGGHSAPPTRATPQVPRQEQRETWKPERAPDFLL